MGRADVVDRGSAAIGADQASESATVADVVTTFTHRIAKLAVSSAESSRKLLAAFVSGTLAWSTRVRPRSDCDGSPRSQFGVAALDRSAQPIIIA